MYLIFYQPPSFELSKKALLPHRVSRAFTMYYGELPALLIVCGFLQGASGWAHFAFVLGSIKTGLLFTLC